MEIVPNVEEQIIAEGLQMKPIERIFLISCIKEQIRKGDKHKEMSVRTIANIFSRLGFPYKRLTYYMEKWTDRGIYNYGVTLDLGWLEFDKFYGEYSEVYNEAISMSDDGWNDRDFYKYIITNIDFKGEDVNEENNKKRFEGKTTEIIKLADNYNGVILVRDQNAAENVKKMAREMKCEVTVQTYSDLIYNRIDKRYLLNKGIFIDDVDIFLNELLKG